MAASKPTYHFNKKTSFTLNFYFRALAYDLGCFPFDLEPSRTKSVYNLTNFFIISFANFKGAYPASPYIYKCFTKKIL